MSPWISHRFLRTQSDDRLLSAAAAGHDRAFEMFVQRHRTALHRYVRKMLGGDRAEDATQQALLNAWIALQRGDDVRNPRAWLFRVAHNTAVDMLRSTRHEHTEQTELSGLGGAQRAVDAQVEQQEVVRDMLAGVAALPHVQREALLRTALAGHSHERVGSALGISAAAVRGLVYRARTNLRSAASALVPPALLGWPAAAHRRLATLRIAGGQAGAQPLLERGAAVMSAGALAVGVAAAGHQVVGHFSHPHHRAAVLAGTGELGATARTAAGVTPTRADGSGAYRALAGSRALDHEGQRSNHDRAVTPAQSTRPGDGSSGDGERGSPGADGQEQEATSQGTDGGHSRSDGPGGDGQHGGDGGADPSSAGNGRGSASSSGSDGGDGSRGGHDEGVSGSSDFGRGSDPTSAAGSGEGSGPSDEVGGGGSGSQGGAETTGGSGSGASSGSPSGPDGSGQGSGDTFARQSSGSHGGPAEALTAISGSEGSS